MLQRFYTNLIVYNLSFKFMDVFSCPFCCFRALLLLIIWLVISISIKGDSGPLILSTKKECSHLEIIGRVPCSQNNIMTSYFDTHKSLSVLDFSSLLNQQDCSNDLREVLINNSKIFGLSSLQRHLIGEGSHRKLVTTMAFYKHPKFTHFVSKHFCEAVIVEYLPTGIFSDSFELQHLVRRKVFCGAAVFGDTNLEFPSALSNASFVEIHFSIKSDTPEVVVQLPLHARYPPLDSSGYSNIKIAKPDLFLRCGPKEDSETGACFRILIDLALFNGSGAPTWRIPCGNEEHSVAVTFFTYFSALICSLLIVLSSTMTCREESKLE